MTRAGSPSHRVIARFRPRHHRFRHRQRHLLSDRPRSGGRAGAGASGGLRSGHPTVPCIARTRRQTRFGPIALIAGLLIVIGGLWWFWAHPNVELVNRLATTATVTLPSGDIVKIAPGAHHSVRLNRRERAMRWQVSPDRRVTPAAATIDRTSRIAFPSLPLGQARVELVADAGRDRFLAPLITNRTSGTSASSSIASRARPGRGVMRECHPEAGTFSSAITPSVRTRRFARCARTVRGRHTHRSRVGNSGARAPCRCRSLTGTSAFGEQRAIVVRTAGTARSTTPSANARRGGRTGTPPRAGQAAG